MEDNVCFQSLLLVNLGHSETTSLLPRKSSGAKLMKKIMQGNCTEAETLEPKKAGLRGLMSGLVMIQWAILQKLIYSVSI